MSTDTTKKCSRCLICKAKIGLLKFDCTFCNMTFCATHRLPEDHECTHMTEARNKYKENNKRKLEQEAYKASKIIAL